MNHHDTSTEKELCAKSFGFTMPCAPVDCADLSLPSLQRVAIHTAGAVAAAVDCHGGASGIAIHLPSFFIMFIIIVYYCYYYIRMYMFFIYICIILLIFFFENFCFCLKTT